MGQLEKERANPPVCWICGRKLAYGGWQYTTIKDEAGYEHPAHSKCAVAERDFGDAVYLEDQYDG